MVAGVPQEERAQIDAVELRLAQKYAELPHDHVAAIVQHVYATFNQSKLRDYVPLLVERRAREVLARSAAARAAVAEVPTPAVAGSETVAVPHKRPEWRSATWAWLGARFAAPAAKVEDLTEREPAHN
jgi:ribosomal protein L12E/L44/L45/RPP1/RPP2